MPGILSHTVKFLSEQYQLIADGSAGPQSPPFRENEQRLCGGHQHDPNLTK
jgi:hypothetical protein